MPPKQPTVAKSKVLQQFNDINQQVTMEKAVENKLTEEHNKRAKEATAHNEEYKMLVAETGGPESDDDYGDDDMDGEEAEIFRRMAEKKMNYYEQDDDLKQKQKRGEVGEFRDVTEEDFFNYVTKNQYVVCNFMHSNMNRCKIAEMHLKKIAYDHPECKFIQVDVDKSPF